MLASQFVSTTKQANGDVLFDPDDMDITGLTGDAGNSSLYPSSSLMELTLPLSISNDSEINHQLTELLQSTLTEDAVFGLPASEMLVLISGALPSAVASGLDTLIDMLAPCGDYEILQQQLEFSALAA